MICDACGDSRSGAKRFVDAAEVVVHEVERDRVGIVKGGG